MRKLKLPTIVLSLLTILLLIVCFAPPKIAAAPCFESGKLNIGGCLLLGSTGKSVGEVYETPADLVNLLVSNIFILGGFILLIMIIYSGFLIMTGGAKGAEQAKGVLGTAVLGFVIMFSAFWVLRLVKIITGADILF